MMVAAAQDKAKQASVAKTKSFVLAKKDEAESQETLEGRRAEQRREKVKTADNPSPSHVLLD